MFSTFCEEKRAICRTSLLMQGLVFVEYLRLTIRWRDQLGHTLTSF